MTDNLHRLHVVITGHVQGVGFRYTTKLKADELGITGWVRNGIDGNIVEVVAEGTQEQLATFQEYLWQGPPSARVDAMDVADEPATGEYNSFGLYYWNGR